MEQAETCCFTGHRPDKLPWGVREDDPRCTDLKARLAAALEAVFNGERPPEPEGERPRGEGEGRRHFICGMARGADLYFAEAVLALRERRSGVTLEAARPCESQASRWPQEEQRRYQSILERCDYETLVQHQYDRWCMMRRNRYMVDRSARLLAVYDGVPKGGTAQTLAYALRKGLAVTILDPV